MHQTYSRHMHTGHTGISTAANHTLAASVMRHLALRTACRSPSRSNLIWLTLFRTGRIASAIERHSVLDSPSNGSLGENRAASSNKSPSVTQSSGRSTLVIARTRGETSRRNASTIRLCMSAGSLACHFLP
jgi:hypothetical protein